MPLAQQDERPSAKTRLAAIRLAVHTLRLMEHWRAALGDYDRVIIILALTAISAEKLTRCDLPEHLQDLRQPMPAERLGTCNVSSIAAAAGFNRETARRKINELIADGIMSRRDDGSLCFAPGFSQQKEVLDLVWRQLETITRTTMDLVRDGALQMQDRQLTMPKEV